MTTTELIKLLQKAEKGASGRSRNISISRIDDNGELVDVVKKSDILSIASTGDGCAGSELNLVINYKI